MDWYNLIHEGLELLTSVKDLFVRLIPYAPTIGLGTGWLALHPAILRPYLELSPLSQELKSQIELIVLICLVIVIVQFLRFLFLNIRAICSRLFAELEVIKAFHSSRDEDKLLLAICLVTDTQEFRAAFGSTLLTLRYFQMVN
jgi:hypothetical protein